MQKQLINNAVNNTINVNFILGTLKKKKIKKTTKTEKFCLENIFLSASKTTENVRFIKALQCFRKALKQIGLDHFYRVIY